MTDNPTPSDEEIAEARSKVTAFVEMNETAPALRSLGRKALADAYVIEAARSELEDRFTDPVDRIRRTLALLAARDEFCQ